MSPVEIIRGTDHLGNCPECGYAMVEYQLHLPRDRSYIGIRVLPAPPPVTARCVLGHVFENPAIIARWDAPSPVWPACERPRQDSNLQPLD